MPRRTDLPSMPLCNGCGACCGPVKARPEEVARIRHYMKENDVVWESRPAEDNTITLACGFLRKQDDESYTCAIHPVRPWVCRAFGVIEEMPCPLFPEAVATSVPQRQAQLLRLVDPADRYLGEHFEAGYLKRIGGPQGGAMIHALAAAALQRQQAAAGKDESPSPVNETPSP